MSELAKTSSLEEFEVIILGGGRGGMNLAAALDNSGKKTLVIERTSRMIGGSCINVACIPTKTFVTCARMLTDAKAAKKFGIGRCSPTVNWSEMRSHVEGVSRQYHDLNYDLLKDTPNIFYVIGEGRFTDKRTIVVTREDGGEQMVRGTLVVVNTGTRPLLPALPGIELVETSESIQKLAHLPNRLVIVGAGFVGLEFAQLFASLGTSVTLINSDDTLLAQEDDDVRELLTETFNEQNIKVIDAARLQSVSRNQEALTATINCNGATSSINADTVLLAVGRKPNTENLQCHLGGITLDDRGFIKVNEHLLTSIEGVYAIGDVNGGPQFTHVSYDDFRIVSDHILGAKQKTSKDRLIPFTLFTTPELSRVGLNERQAIAGGVDVEVMKFPLGMMPRAKMRGNDKGFLKLLIDRKTGKLAGSQSSPLIRQTY